MKIPSDPWDIDGPEIETLIKAVEEGGLSHEIAMGELLRALYGIFQTLGGHQAVSKRTGQPEDASANERSS